MVIFGFQPFVFLCIASSCWQSQWLTEVLQRWLRQIILPAKIHATQIHLVKPYLRHVDAKIESLTACWAGSTMSFFNCLHDWRDIHIVVTGIQISQAFWYATVNAPIPSSVFDLRILIWRSIALIHPPSFLVVFTCLQLKIMRFNVSTTAESMLAVDGWATSCFGLRSEMTTTSWEYQAHQVWCLDSSFKDGTTNVWHQTLNFDTTLAEVFSLHWWLHTWTYYIPDVNLYSSYFMVISSQVQSLHVSSIFRVDNQSYMLALESCLEPRPSSPCRAVLRSMTGPADPSDSTAGWWLFEAENIRKAICM